MDKAIDAAIGPWAQLGIIGSVVIALTIVVALLWRALDKRTDAHMAAVEKCHDKTLEMTVSNIQAQNKMADALDGNSQVMRAALDALKRI